MFCKNKKDNMNRVGILNFTCYRSLFKSPFTNIARCRMPTFSTKISVLQKKMTDTSELKTTTPTILHANAINKLRLRPDEEFMD